MSQLAKTDFSGDTNLSLCGSGSSATVLKGQFWREKPLVGSSWSSDNFVCGTRQECLCGNRLGVLRVVCVQTLWSREFMVGSPRGLQGIITVHAVAGLSV